MMAPVAFRVYFVRGQKARKSSTVRRSGSRLFGRGLNSPFDPVERGSPRQPSWFIPPILLLPQAFYVALPLLVLHPLRTMSS